MVERDRLRLTQVILPMGVERNSAPDTKFYYNSSEEIRQLTVKSVPQKTQDTTK